MNKLKKIGMVGLALAVVLALLPNEANSAIKRFFQDVKLPNQRVLEYQSFGAPVVTTTNYVKTTFAGATSAAAVTLTSFTAQPDVPRNITITPTGSTGDVEAACDIVVTGTNIFNDTITETFDFAENASSVINGTKAFKTVTSVLWPAGCETTAAGEPTYAATWIIGVGEKIGLRRCMDRAGEWGWSLIDGVYETTRATIVADADEVEKNVADFNGTMDASAVFRGYFIQNYQCTP